jgi:hypothetical protein
LKAVPKWVQIAKKILSHPHGNFVEHNKVLETFIIITKCIIIIISSSSSSSSSSSGSSSSGSSSSSSGSSSTGSKNSIQAEMKSRLKLDNVCYYSVQNLLSSRLLSKNLKIKK